MADETPLKVAMVVGEASGDMLAASLIKALRDLHPNIEFEGIGGPLMLEEGFKSLYPMNRLSVMGFIEPLKRLPELLSIRSGLIKHFIQNRPDVFIGIDSPDFNLGVEKSLKTKGIPTVHYVSPSVWAWRQGRIKTIRKAVDLVLCLLPFEADFYRQAQVSSAFVGHPMADEIDVKIDKEQYRHIFSDVVAAKPLIAILPGSRLSEIEKNTPVFFETADKLYQQNKGAAFLVPASSPEIGLVLQELAEGRPYLKIVDGQARQVLGAADVALVASGTATLEALLMKCPMVVAYKVDRLTYLIGKSLVKIKHLSLANLIAGKGLVVERIQDEATVDNLFRDVQTLLDGKDVHSSLIETFETLHRALRQDASRTAANAVLRLVRQAS